MISVTNRDELKGERKTAKFEGAEHGSEVSLFWVDGAPGTGPDMHWHPYTETWVVLRGEALIESEGDSVRAVEGAIVTVPAEARHRFRSTGAENLEMVCVHASPHIIQQFVEPTGG